MSPDSVHQPVLLQEVLHTLESNPGDFMIDGTIDGGGHAMAILEKISPRGRLLGLDWDKTMIERWRAKIADRKKALFIHANYVNLPEILKQEKLPLADGLLLDLGFSSEQIEHTRTANQENKGRGFSFAESGKDEPLLMTYDDSREPVWKILRELKEEQLANIIFELGGERMSRRIAKAIKDRGRKKAIMTAGELAETIREAVPKNYEHGRIDPATRTFQAFRIYANGELENVQNILKNLSEVIKPGGRVAVITFHSLEDRIVKQAFQKLAKEQKAELLNKKPIPATREEILKNPRSRSAKLRAIRVL